MFSDPLVCNAFKRLAAGASPSEKAALFHDTVQRFYRLPLPPAVTSAPPGATLASSPG